MTAQQTRRDVMGGARPAASVDAFMQGIRWSNAQALFERYAKEA